MPIFTQDSLERLRQRIDLVEVIGSHVDLKAAGATYKALCPFHDERSPSFTVQRGGHHYHCFGCGAHGDAIQFLMEHLKMSFGDAIESLAERFQVRLEKAEEGDREKGVDRKRMKEALQLAGDFYHFMLLHSPEGHEALEYLYGRGLSLAFIERFSIGYAPKQSMLSKLLRSKSYSDEILLQAGLLADRRGRRVDFFSDRIMFPIYHSTGYPVGFSGRKFKEETFGGKYVNTSETPLFKKSRLLYGMNYCRRTIAKKREAVAVEGQVDALAMIFAGFEITIASQGTAFGEGHVKELANLGVERLFLAFDADEAGFAATIKVGNLFQSAGISARVVQMPPGKDPDVLLREEGKEAMQARLDSSLDYLTFLVGHYEKRIDIHSPEGKNRLVSQLVKQIRDWEQPLLVHESLRKVAHLMQIPESMVTVGHSLSPNIHIKRSASVGAFSIDPDRILESDFLRWLILAGDKLTQFLEMTRASLKPTGLHVAVCAALYQALLAQFDEGQGSDLLGLASRLDAEGQELLSTLSEKRVRRERAEEHFEETLQRILQRNWMEKREAVRLKINSGRATEEELTKLVQLFDELKNNPPTIQKPCMNT